MIFSNKDGRAAKKLTRTVFPGIIRASCRMTAPTPRITSFYALIAANAVTALGVFFLGWDARDMVLLFWVENLIIGLFALLRVIFAPGNIFAKVFTIPFFCFHFGMFTFVHGIFVVLLTFGPDGFQDQGLRAMALMALKQVLPAAAALFLSHGYSFVANYLVLGEYKRTDVKREMERPYSRVVIMHFTILAAFFLMVPLGLSPGEAGTAARMVPALVLLAIKTLADASAHLKAHTERVVFGEPEQPDPAL